MSAAAAATPPAPRRPESAPSIGARAAWAIGLALAATFALPGPGLALVLLLVVLSFAASRRLGVLARLLPAGLALAAFAVVVNAWLTPGERLVAAWPWSPTREGVVLGLVLAIRLGLTALAFAWLAATSEASAVLDALHSGPLRRLGRTGERLGLVALVALRFGPLVGEEARRLLRAVSLRAGRRPGPWAAPAVAVPLVLAAVRRADRLAYVLEARHYGSGPRTPPPARKGGWRDFGLAAAGVLVVALALVAR
jgi:energy-coupling factor transporter transmembrane protein EcfT